MLKPSDEIKLLFEDILCGRRKADEFSKKAHSAIIQAIIHYLDINAIMAEEKRKATGGKKPSDIWQ